VRKRFAIHLEKVFNEFIIEPKTDSSPPRKTVFGETVAAAAAAPAAAGVKRKGDEAVVAAAAASDPKRKPPVGKKKKIAMLKLPFTLFKDQLRYREQQYREKELLEKISPSQLRQDCQREKRLKTFPDIPYRYCTVQYISVFLIQEILRFWHGSVFSDPVSKITDPTLDPTL
jgi:hypothetical protein